MTLATAAAAQASRVPAVAASPRDGELLQEFFLGETVYTQHRNELQLTVGSVWRHAPGRPVFLDLPGVLEFGVTDRLQVSTDFTVAAVPEANAAAGLADLEVGALYAVRQDVRWLALSLGLAYSVPAVGGDERDDERRWTPIVVAAQSIGRSEIHVAISPQASRTVAVRLGAVYPIGSWRATLEAAASVGPGGGLVAAPGVVWRTPFGLEAGIGVPLRVTGGPVNQRCIVLLTYEVEF